MVFGVGPLVIQLLDSFLAFVLQTMQDAVLLPGSIWRAGIVYQGAYWVDKRLPRNKQKGETGKAIRVRLEGFASTDDIPANVLITLLKDL